MTKPRPMYDVSHYSIKTMGFWGRGSKPTRRPKDDALRQVFALGRFKANRRPKTVTLPKLKFVENEDVRDGTD